MLKHENVTLLKKDGTEIPNIWADVRPDPCTAASL
jgi:hypothetical protein